MRRDELDRISEHWGTTDPVVSDVFYGWPPLRPYFYRCITGEEPTGVLERDWLERWVVDRYLSDRTPVARCVSLCCGFGEIERILARFGVFEHCIGLDLAGKALEEARDRASAEGLRTISYAMTDINDLKLRPNSCDLIWANGALHHLNDLEHVAAEIYAALKPGGLLVAGEYIGPRHQRLDARQLEIVNAVIHLIPPRLRGLTEDNFVPSRFKGPLWLNRSYRLATGQGFESEVRANGARRPLVLALRAYRKAVAALRRRRFRFGKVWDLDPWYYRHVDPSEAARSNEIVPVFRKHFGDLEVRTYNGSVLLYCLDSVFRRNFDPTSEEDVTLLSMLTRLESDLIETGELDPDHALLIGRKPA